MKLFSVCIASILISQYCNVAPQRLEVENQIITGSIDRPDLVGSIDPPPRILNCEGNVRLQTINESRILDDRRIFSPWVRKRGMEVIIRRMGYELATVEGSCCWKAWSSKRGGSFHVMRFAGVHEPGFTIRRM